MLRFKLLLALGALLVLIAAMPLAMAGGVCHAVSGPMNEAPPAAAPAVASVEPAAAPHHGGARYAMDGCDMAIGDGNCLSCCLVAPAPRAAVLPPQFAAYQPDLPTISATAGRSIAPPKRPPRG